MKVLSSLALILTASIFAACTHDSQAESTPAETTTTQSSEPSAKEGWENIKSGSKEAASGAGEVAKDTGNKVVEGTKEVGRDIKEGAKEAAHDVKATACPVLGNKLTKVYYTKTSRNYNSLLSGKTALSYDNRECFSSEANAREAGFKSSAN